ncbi:uncharacterized protein LOC134238415 [Saccostrea cucullata]|uniref:uncharacterized protein LOC134238415 n=1 Tax=Saccostrea cuccullata TaxID=36930 RepID=UPI002ED38633
MKCKDDCPVGTFGKLCTGTCQCKSGCDKRIGCPTSSNSSFHTRRLLLIVFPTSIMAISLTISILILKNRGVNLCQKCNDYSLNNNEKKETVSVSNIVYKGNKEKEGEETCWSETRTVPILSSINHVEKASGSFNEDDSNAEIETGVYNTLTLRVTGYVEPSAWTRHSTTDIHSDASSTCSRTKVLGDSLSSGEMTSDERLYRDASICLQKSDNRNKSMQTFQQEGIDYRENRTDSVSINSEDGYVFDETVQEDMGMAGELRQKHLFMKELSSQLMNINKN